MIPINHQKKIRTRGYHKSSRYFVYLIYFSAENLTNLRSRNEHRIIPSWPSSRSPPFCSRIVSRHPTPPSSPWQIDQPAAPARCRWLGKTWPKWDWRYTLVHIYKYRTTSDYVCIYMMYIMMYTLLLLYSDPGKDIFFSRMVSMDAISMFQTQV